MLLLVFVGFSLSIELKFYSIVIILIYASPDARTRFTRTRAKTNLLTIGAFKFHSQPPRALLRGARRKKR